MSVAATIQSCLSEHKVDFELVPHPKTYSSHDRKQLIFYRMRIIMEAHNEST